MSDLQCPVRFLLVPADGAEDLAAGTGERFALVVAPEQHADLGAVLGERFDARVSVRPATDDRDDLGDLADLHRGEAVLVVADPAPAGVALPARLDLDGDGWVAHPWPAVQG